MRERIDEHCGKPSPSAELLVLEPAAELLGAIRTSVHLPHQRVELVLEVGHGSLGLLPDLLRVVQLHPKVYGNRTAAAAGASCSTTLLPSASGPSASAPPGHRPRSSMASLLAASLTP